LRAAVPLAGGGGFVEAELAPPLADDERVAVELLTMKDVGAQLMDLEFLPGGRHFIARERLGEMRIYEAAAEQPLSIPGSR